MPRPVYAKSRIALAALVAACAAPALAQVAPPPARKPAGLQRPVRPPPPVPQEKREELIQQRQRDIERQQRQQEIEAEQRRSPQLPYASLVQRRDDGSLIELGDPIELAALRQNPMLAQIARDRVLALAAERQRRIERRVIERLDLLDALLVQNEVGRVRVNDRGELDRVRSMVTEFTIDNGLTAWLQAQRHITRPQALFNGRIANEYRDALRLEQMSAPAADSPPPSVTDRLARFYLRTDLQDYEVAYQRLIERLVQRAALGELAIPPQLRERLLNTTDSAAAARDWLSSKPLETRREVLRLVAE